MNFSRQNTIDFNFQYKRHYAKVEVNYLFAITNIEQRNCQKSLNPLYVVINSGPKGRQCHNYFKRK